MFPIILIVVLYLLGMFETDLANTALKRLYPEDKKASKELVWFVLITWPFITLYMVCASVVLFFKMQRIERKVARRLSDADIEIYMEVAKKEYERLESLRKNKTQK